MKSSMMQRLAWSCALPAFAFCLPSAPRIASGSAEFSLIGGNTLEVAAVDRTWIEWSEFSLAEEELVRFVLPDAQDLVVNQAMGNEASRIFGKIVSNGQIVLINPSGVLFGKSAQIDTAGLIASTLDLNRDFFAAKKGLKFEGNSPSSMHNEGILSTRDGPLFLIGAKVESAGSMQAAAGAGLLAVTSCVFSESALLEASLPREGIPARASLSGIIESDASVFVLGNHIFLKSGSSISARGGDVFAGSGVRGENWPRADYLRMEEGASICTGGGTGTVVLWGTHVNGFYGDIVARGNGKGGFVETSSLGWLAAEGRVDTGGGIWLLDPTTVTISSAGNSGITAGNLPTPPPAVLDPYIAPYAGPTANINNTALGNALGVNNVIIDAALGAGGAGTITVNNPVAWMAGFSLTLNAPGNITINADIQHSIAATGGVFINSGQNVSVLGSAAGETSVGSQNSQTSVAAGGNVIIQGSAGGGNRAAQIGFFTPDATTAAGPIQVDCVNLTMQTGASQLSGAQIGHGRINSTVMIPTPITVAGADISVNAAGNIGMTNGGLNAYVLIGHGNASLPTGADQTGDIRVVCGGNLTMNGLNPGANSILQIGHSISSPNADNGPVLTGLVDVRIGGNLTIDGNGMIGHGGRFSNTSAQMLNGDITLCCGGTATLTQSGGAIYIGHYVPERPGFSLTSINGDYNISIAGNLAITTLQSGVGAGNCIIGYNEIVRDPALNCTLDVSVCGNVTISVPSVSGNSVAIGLRSGDNAGSTTSTNIAVGGNFTAANIRNGLFLGSNRFDFNFAVGGNLTCTQLSSNGFVTSGPNGVTRIFAGGTILGDSQGGSTFFFGRTNAVGYQTQSIDVRAGGDIIWPNSFSPALTAPISFQAGHSFAAGELWTSNGTQLATICQQAFGLDLLCGTCSSFAVNSPASASSCGAFSLSPNGATNVNFTTSSTLTLTSLCTNCSGGASSLLIGTGAANDVALTNPVGPLNIGPFNTVDVNQDLTSTGSISIAACAALNVNPGTDIVSTGPGSPITLLADADNSGSGNLNLAGGNITSNNGQICLLAGPGTFGCSSSNCLTGIPGLIAGATSTVNQTSGSVNSGAAPTIAVASGDILIDGSATSIGTMAGPISLTAGNDILILENIVSTGGSVTSISGRNTTVDSALVSAAGEIRMIAGNDLNLEGTASLTAGSFVTLVVDNNFPSQPLIGTGLFSMSCSAQITSGPGSPVRIFTALQSLNAVCSGALINGFSVGDPLFNYPSAALFQDTPSEVWCTYFDCPSPYPFPSLGFPFTFFYKDCLQVVLEQATEIVDQFLVSLHPYNEFPGWMAKFWLNYADSVSSLSNEPFMLRRRQLNAFNHPKSYTQLVPE